MTLKEVIDFALARTNTVGDGRFPFLLLREYTNQAQREIQMQMWQSGFRKFEKTASLTVTPTSFMGVDNCGTASLPSDLLEVPEAIRFILCTDAADAGVNNYPAFEVNEMSLFEIANNAFLVPTLLKPVFARINNTIYVFPSGHDSYTINYYYRIADLSTGSTSSGLPTELHGQLAELVIARIKQDLAMYNESQVLYNKVLSEIKTFSQANQVAQQVAGQIPNTAEVKLQ